MKTGIITLVEYHNKLNTKWMREEFKELLNMVDGYELCYAHNWAGEVNIEELKNRTNYKIGCSLLIHQLVLLPNGDITVCCADLNPKGVITNLNGSRCFKNLLGIKNTKSICVKIVKRFNYQYFPMES